MIESINKITENLKGSDAEGEFDKVKNYFINNMDSIVDKQANDHAISSEKYRKYTLINCWHMNEYESAAMWDLYSSNGRGVAIQTSYNRFKKCFLKTEETVYIGKVLYIDYNSTWVPERNIMSPFLHKRLSYEFERELRAIISKLPLNNNKIDFSIELFKDGLYVDIDLDTLIENIYICPTAPEWFCELMVTVIRKFGYDFNVVKSSLCENPVW